MSNVSVQVNPSFQRVGKAISLIKLGAALQKGIEKLAFGVERFSKKQTPVDTGRLRSSINTSIGNFEARIAPHVSYAGWIHEGKMNRGGQTVYIQGGGKAGTPPGGKPFMRLGKEQAFKSFGDDPVVKELKTEIRAGIARI